MAMFRDRRVNRRWRRVFRTLYTILALSFLTDFLPLNEEVGTFFLIAGAIAGLAGLIFLWFLYNSPDKLKMQEDNDMFNNN
jgi:multisubunit Na+/H+ antiporter MnhB subunit